MADYKSIKGVRIQNFTTDPDNPITGQVWYNESVNALKFQYPTTVNAWSTGGNLNTTRYNIFGSGTQTTGLVAGGDQDPGIVANTELYDGTSWSATTDLNNGRSGLMSGNASPNSASIAVGGRTSTVAVALTEEFTGEFNAVETFTTS